MLILNTTVVLVITFAVLVIAHEFGHYLAAKLVGIRVEEFALGFGPRLIRVFRRGDTDYTIHPAPLGGFVKLSGMEPGEGEDDPHGYNAQPVWKRFIVIFAGPFMSFVLAYVVFCSLGATVGLPVPGVSRNVVGEVQRGTAAERAGLQPGDRIVAVDEAPVRTGDDIRKIVFISAGKKLSLRVERSGRALTVAATPEQGVVAGKKVGLLGVLLEPPRARYGIGGSIVQGTRMTAALLRSIFEALSSKEGLKGVGGIVAITRYTAEGVKHGPDQIVFNLAALSLSLAIINLVPWPILDGGHLVLLWLELIRRKKLTVKQMQVFQTVGLATLVALVLLLVYVDLVRWVPLNRPLAPP